MMKKQQVWLVLDSRSFGGIETHVLELAKGLAKFQIDVEVVFLANYGNHPLLPLLKEHGISFRVMNWGIFSLALALIKEQPLLVHTHGYKADIYGRLAGFLASCTLVSTFHAGEVLSGKLALYDFVDRVSATLSHALIAVSAKINARLKNQCTVVNNFIGVNHQDFPGDQIAFVGRLSHEKGPDLFLELSTFFQQRLFHIYGDGPMLESLKQRAGDNVVFHGYQHNMAKQWHNIGLLVMPSRHEGLPMAALEAMAHGIPVCAFNVGALDSLVNSRNGWIAESQDLKCLRYGICQWLSSTTKQKFTRSRFARKSVIAKFSDVTVIPIIIDCYNQALIKNQHENQQFNVKYLP